jgi:UDP-N-acetylmuramyl tripeptide synthase
MKSIVTFVAAAESDTTVRPNLREIVAQAADIEVVETSDVERHCKASSIRLDLCTTLRSLPAARSGC